MDRISFISPILSIRRYGRDHGYGLLLLYATVRSDIAPVVAHGASALRFSDYLPYQRRYIASSSQASYRAASRAPEKT